MNKTPSKPRKHTKSVTKKGCPNYIKEPNQHIIKHNVPKALSKKRKSIRVKQNTHAQKLISFKKVKTNIKEWDNQLPIREQGSNTQIKLSTLFMMAQSTNKKKACLPKQNTKIDGSKGCYDRSIKRVI